jgi:hypothetical protein
MPEADITPINAVLLAETDYELWLSGAAGLQ